MHTPPTQICKANGYSSETGGPMTVVHGKLEELPGLPAGVEQVGVCGCLKNDDRVLG